MTEKPDLKKLSEIIYDTPFYNPNSIHAGGQKAGRFLELLRSRIRETLGIDGSSILIFTRSLHEGLAISVGSRNIRIFCYSNRAFEDLEACRRKFILNWKIELRAEPGKNPDGTYYISMDGSERDILVCKRMNSKILSFIKNILKEKGKYLTLFLAPEASDLEFGGCVINPPDEQIFPAAVYEGGYLAGTPSLWMARLFTERLCSENTQSQTNP